MLQDLFHVWHAIAILAVAAQYVIFYLVDAVLSAVAAHADALFIALLLDATPHATPLLYADQHPQFPQT